MRSKLFCSLLVDALDRFLSLAVGFCQAHPLPPPTASADLLCKATVEALEVPLAAAGIEPLLLWDPQLLRLGSNGKRRWWPRQRRNGEATKEEAAHGDGNGNGATGADYHHLVHGHRAAPDRR
jgi:hypothetical protein